MRCGALPLVSGQETLEYLERANLFIVPLDNERQWYRYHRLFADLLRQRLQQATSDVAEYHLRASQWYEANGYMAEAFHHAIAAKDFARAADVAERAWQSMDDTFQTAAWLGWIKQLPEEVIRVRPVLCTQMGWPSWMPANRRPANDTCEMPNAGWRAQRNGLSGGSVSLPGRIALARAYNAQVQGDLAATVKYAELALQLIPEDDVYRRAQATIMLDFTHWANGDLEAARRDDGRLDEQHAAVWATSCLWWPALLPWPTCWSRRAVCVRRCARMSSHCSWPLRLARRRKRSRRIIIWDWRCCIVRWMTPRASPGTGRKPKSWASTRHWWIGHIAGVWLRPA